ncbi:cytochrome P450 [Apiospora sp. TS-2023a]
MISKGGNLHRVLRDRYKLPIYTLRLPGMRVYVVNSRPLITAIQGQFRTLSFTAYATSGRLDRSNSSSLL